MNAGLRRENGTGACLGLACRAARDLADEAECSDDDALGQRQQGKEQKKEVVGLPQRQGAQMHKHALAMPASHYEGNGCGDQGQKQESGRPGWPWRALKGDGQGADQAAAKDQGAEKRHQMHGFAPKQPGQGRRIGQNQQAEAGGSDESGLPLLLLLHGRLPVRWDEAAKLIKNGAAIGCCMTISDTFVFERQC